MKKDNNSGGFPAPDPERGAARVPGRNGGANPGDGAADAGGTAPGNDDGSGQPGGEPQGPMPGRDWQQAGALLSGSAATDGNPATGPLPDAATTVPTDPTDAGTREADGAGTAVGAGSRAAGDAGYGTDAAPSFLGRMRLLFGRRNHAVVDEAAPEEPEEQTTLVAGTHHPIFTGFMLTVGVGLALLLFFILTNVGQLLVWIAIALFIALGLDPIVRFLERHQVPRPAGVIAAMLLLALLVGGVFGTLIPTIVSQTSAFAAKAPGFVDSFLNSDFFITVDRQFQIRERISEEVDKFFQNSDAVGGVFGGVIGAGSVIAQSLFGMLIVFVLAIYFLASLPGLKAWCYRLAPRSRRARVQALSEQITNSVGNYVMGQVCVALLNAAYAFIIMTIVGVPYSLLLTLLVALLAFVPLVGAVIAGILVSLIALTVSWETAVVYAIFYFAYLQFEAYFISPRVMQRAVAVPGAVAVIAVIAGGALMGIIGALMAIPLAASAMLLIREVFMARQERH